MVSTVNQPQGGKTVLYHKVNRRFTLQEDKKLRELVALYGQNDWHSVAAKMEKRNARQCKDRWYQYLSPNSNQSPWSVEEEENLKRLYSELKGKWTEIAKFFPGRADAQVRNKWRTLQRRMGLLKPIRKSIIDDLSSVEIQQTQKIEENEVSFNEFVFEDQPESSFFQFDEPFAF